jgi:tetratricopeptide (TPR) repeat protein
MDGGIEVDNRRTVLQRAVELRQIRHFQAAVDLLSTLDSGRPDVAYELAWALDCMDRDQEAITYYRRALRRSADPAVEAHLSREDHHGALLGLAAVLLRTGRADLAMDVLTSASSHFPHCEQVSGLLAVAQVRLLESID